jgi:hypothetical protein
VIAACDTTVLTKDVSGADPRTESRKYTVTPVDSAMKRLNLEENPGYPMMSMNNAKKKS